MILPESVLALDSA
jgi:trimeric autotransporter adhesin